MLIALQRFVVVVAVVLVASATLPLHSGDWHDAATLICSDCHTVHNSEQGQPMRYDGSPRPAPDLLRAEDATHLCLSCHDGSRPGAPDVVAPVSGGIPAAGWFSENPLGRENPAGHDLLSGAPLPAPGGGASMVLSCVSCHSPHGAPNHRNLHEQPGAQAGPAVTVVVDPWPGSSAPGVVRSTAATTTAAGSAGGAVSYLAGGQLYRSGMSAWCAACHGNFHGRDADGEGTGEPWMRHPQGERIQGAYGADFAHWSSEIPDRVPVESPADDRVPSPDDRVFCLSCHRAHGTAHPDALIWADGAQRMSSCQQCHNQ